MAGPFLSRQHELYAQLEATYGVSPGALVGGDAFKANAAFPWTPVIARYDRDKDQGNEASVLSTQKGKEHSTWQVAGDVIPSGNAATPTAPDMDVFYEAHFGEKFTCTAHTTTAAGSAGVTLNLTPGGGAASGIRTTGGDLIAVDVSTAASVEVRQVVSRATDVVTVDRAFTTDPAAARAVYVGTTYRCGTPLLALKSLHLWGYLEANNFRHKTGGNSVKALNISADFSSQTPVLTQTVSGEGKGIETHANARPTAVTAGEPLLPSAAKVFIGASGVLCLVKAGLQSDNAAELRQNESCTLVPSGLKRTGNGGNIMVTQNLDMLLLTGTVEGYFDNQFALTAYDVIVQNGVLPGKIVAWRTPKWIPEAPPGDQDGEVSLQMSGRAYALTTPGSEVSFAFI